VWLDVERLRPGDRWMEALETAFADSAAFLVYVGHSGVQRWVDRETRLALVRNTDDPAYRIVPLLAPGVDPTSLPAFLAQHQAITLPTDDTDRTWLQRLSGALGSEPARRVSQLAADEPPFRGLMDFRPEHAHLFFGRDREVEELLDRLRDRRLLAVV